MKTAIALIALLLAAPSWARILDSHTDIRIAKSGEVTVTERVTLEVNARQPHSMLLREVPARARVLEVTRNGRPEPWEVAGARLRIGARGDALPDGKHVYRLSYSAGGLVSFLDYVDELRWSLPGAESLTAEVSLPEKVPARDMKLTAAGAEYQGFVGNGRAALRSKGPIVLTLRFPKGVVDEAPVFPGAVLHWFRSLSAIR